MLTCLRHRHRHRHRNRNKYFIVDFLQTTPCNASPYHFHPGFIGIQASWLPCILAPHCIQNGSFAGIHCLFAFCSTFSYPYCEFIFDLRLSRHFTSFPDCYEIRCNETFSFFGKEPHYWPPPPGGSVAQRVSNWHSTSPSFFFFFWVLSVTKNCMLQ